MHFCILHRNSRWILSRIITSPLYRYSEGQKFLRNRAILTISDINTFFCFRQKFKMAGKNGGKTIFHKSCQLTLWTPWGSKILFKSLYLAPFLRQIHFYVLRRNLRWPPRMSGKRLLEKVRYPGVNFFFKISLSRTIFEINAFLHFTQKFKMAAKSGGKRISGKSPQTLRIPWG